ncbi:MAG: hypothetical protein J5746_09515 [Victivallales bacterium]|nr:hypothetical protein [Victivallales bacterium]
MASCVSISFWKKPEQENPEQQAVEDVQQEEGVKQTLKVGLYLDEGCRGNGPFNWARLLANSPQIELTLLNGKGIRDGRLSEIQLLLCPGGGGAKQIGAMRPDGYMNVKKFVEEGGMYLGICAGSYNAMNRTGRFGFLAYDYIQGAGKLADLEVDFNEDGAKMLGIKPGKRVVRYNGGNIMKATDPIDKGQSQVLSVFNSSVSGYGKEALNFLGTPSVVYGTYGKGKVLASSFHPESYESTHDIALGYIYALSGVRPVPKYPEKSPKPVRVGFMSLACVGPLATYEMLEMDKDPSLDVDVFSLHEINTGSLRHYDVIVMPDGDEGSYKRMFEKDFYKSQIDDFLKRGGRILASGNGGTYLPKHKNIRILPVDDNFVKYAK